MRILIVNEYVNNRGAEEIAKYQFNYFKKIGHQVRFLTFNNINNHSDTFLNEGFLTIPIPHMYKMFFSPYHYYLLRKNILDYNPDCIIAHNIFSSPLTVYKSLKGYKTIQIVHDYKIVCPTSICVRNDGNICSGYQYSNCVKECSKDSNPLKLFLQYYMAKRLETVRKKYVDLFIAPSKKLTEYLVKYGYRAKTINNPISLSQDSPKVNISFCKEKKRFVYAGAICREKGITEFLTELVSRKEQFTIDLYGSIDKDYDLSFFSNDNRITFKGPIKHDDLMKKLISYDFMVVPSMWMENYPTSILEAQANGVVVIGSDRGGIPEMLEDEKGLVFKYGEKESIRVILDKAFSMSLENYGRIRDKAKNYVEKNNNIEVYMNNVMNEVRKLL